MACNFTASLAIKLFMIYVIKIQNNDMIMGKYFISLGQPDMILLLKVLNWIDVPLSATSSWPTFIGRPIKCHNDTMYLCDYKKKNQT